MVQLAHTFSTTMIDDTATVYIVEAWGAPQPNGIWEGWLEFVPTDGGAVLRTGRETTQSHLGALTYWATGLEPAYLEGAFERAAREDRRDSAAA